MPSGQEYVVLAFFKEKNIDYIYNSSENIVEFPCLRCYMKVKMCTINTLFQCENCNLDGNIITLIKSENLPTTAKVYNPKREIIAIKQSFERLLSKDLSNNTFKSIERIKLKVENLIDFYNKNTS